jgi:hypothetical protein
MPGALPRIDVQGSRWSARTGLRGIDDRGGMRIGYVNRLYKTNLSAVAVTRTGDAKFVSAHAGWD